jgi:hypothetical protein
MPRKNKTMQHRVTFVRRRLAFSTAMVVPMLVLIWLPVLVLKAELVWVATVAPGWV